METQSSGILITVLRWASVELAPLAALLVSIVYFVSSPGSEPIARRFLVSAHGAVVAGMYIGALLLSNRSSPSFAEPFQLLFVLPLALIGISLALYRGTKAVHWLQGVNLLCLAWTYFIGGMAVTGAWL